MGRNRAGLAELLRAMGAPVSSSWASPPTIRLGHRVAVVAEGIRAIDLHPGDGRRAIEAMVAAGVDYR